MAKTVRQKAQALADKTGITHYIAIKKGAALVLQRGALVPKGYHVVDTIVPVGDQAADLRIQAELDKNSYLD